MSWKLRGHDTFENEPYPIEGEYDSQSAAETAAEKELGRLEKEQPTESSGGQDDDGIQDRIFVVRPDGTEYRYLPGGCLNGAVPCCVIIRETASSLFVETEDGRTVNVETNLPDVQKGHKGFLLEHKGRTVFIREPYGDD